MSAGAVAEPPSPHTSVSGSMQRGSSFAALLTKALTGRTRIDSDRPMPVEVEHTGTRRVLVTEKVQMVG